jgi:hypothetical protein
MLYWGVGDFESMLEEAKNYFQVIRKNYSAIVLFTCGIILAILILQTSSVKNFALELMELPGIGQILLGFLYTTAFTAPVATVLIINIAESINPVWLATLGGIGAMLYDLAIFAFVKNQTQHGWFQHWRGKFLSRPVISWCLAILGAAVIASPLPDELGSGLLGLSRLPQKYFIPMSFLLNGIGIFILAAIGRS